jgi:transposase
VARWRGRYATRRLAGRTDEPRPGAPRTIIDDRVDEVLATTLAQAPPNGTHWSTRQRAQRLGMSQTAVSRIWRAFGLAAHRTDTFELPRELSREPQVVEKVRDVVAPYLAPPERALVLCVDE